MRKLFLIAFFVFGGSSYAQAPRSHAARLEFATAQYKKAAEAYKAQGPEAFFENGAGLSDKGDRTFVMTLLRGLPELPVPHRSGEKVEFDLGKKEKVVLSIENPRNGVFQINQKMVTLNYAESFKTNYEKVLAHIQANPQQASMMEKGIQKLFSKLETKAVAAVGAPDSLVAMSTTILAINAGKIGLRPKISSGATKKSSGAKKSSH